MNKIIFSFLLFVGIACLSAVWANGYEIPIDSIQQKVEQLALENQNLKNAVSNLQKETQSLEYRVRNITTKNDSVTRNLHLAITSNTERISGNHQATTLQIETVESNSTSHIHQLTLWGVLLAVVLLSGAVILYLVLHRENTKGFNDLSAIRKAQNCLQEESIKLDTKLVEILDKLPAFDGTKSGTSSPDHSLALKIADEITRIEKNLSRMDDTIKGYKPLIKAVERIKDNFKANGYEIVTYIDQPYNEGMRINPEFVIDEELPMGTRIITSVSKPQVHYNGELIQKATVTVSQNI